MLSRKAGVGRVIDQAWRNDFYAGRVPRQQPFLDDVNWHGLGCLYRHPKFVRQLVIFHAKKRSAGLLFANGLLFSHYQIFLAADETSGLLGYR